MLRIVTQVIFWSFILGIFACQQGKEEQELEKIETDFSDAVIKQIYDLQNSRKTDRILPFLTIDNPNHRYQAALSLASVQDTSAINDLFNVLNDDYEEIRSIAAFALGQTKNFKAAGVLASSFRKDSSRMVQAAILEAIGRCGTEEQLKYLCTTSPYPIKDSVLLEGQALGLYRFALRGMVHPEGTMKVMNDFVANSLMPPKPRFVAANYLARAKDIDLVGYENVLINNVQEEKDPNTLMFLLTGLAKVKTNKALKVLNNTYKNHKDYRVRCNIIRSLKHFDYDSAKTVAFTALKDTNLHVKITAAEYFYYNGKDIDAFNYTNIAKATPHWQVRTMLYAAALKNLIYYKTQSKNFISQTLIKHYRETTNLYEKAALLRALGNFGWNYKFLSKALTPATDSSEIPFIIKSSAAEALVILRNNPNLSKEFGLSTQRVLTELNAIFRRCIESNDPAVVAIVADLFASKSADFKKAFPDYSFLKTAQQKLKLPKDIETYIYLQKAIDVFEGKTTKINHNNRDYFTDIEWSLIKALGETAKVSLQTNKGKIVLQLLTKDAPATVTQFVNLVKAGYYKDKTFHRVVPNFVVQTGCARGDGWGGFDVSVASEFSKVRYTTEGMVGMASAGKDTESTQFFITHCPTIHLDGNYTIFAKVVQGMDIVHKLQVGDKIENAVLEN